MKIEFMLYFNRRPRLVLTAEKRLDQFVFEAGDENQSFTIGSVSLITVMELLLRMHSDARRCVYKER